MVDVGQDSNSYFLDQFKLYAHILEVPMTQLIRVDSRDSNIVYQFSALPGSSGRTDEAIWRISRKTKRATKPEADIEWAQDVNGDYGTFKCIADNRESLTYA